MTESCGSSRNGCGMDCWTVVFCSSVQLERSSGVPGSTWGVCRSREPEWLLRRSGFTALLLKAEMPAHDSFNLT